MSSTSPNLKLSLIATSQNNKETVANSEIVGLDEAMCGNQTFALADADFTVPQSDALASIFLKFTRVLTANRHIILPSGSAKMWIVLNATTSTGSIDPFTLIFEVGTDSVVAAISDGNAHLIYSDGVGTVKVCS